MNIQWTRARLAMLTPEQVHDLFKLRVDVFVVEQACAYAGMWMTARSSHIAGSSHPDPMATRTLVVLWCAWTFEGIRYHGCSCHRHLMW